MHGVEAALRELADEVERDDRLAGARPALDEDDRLLRVVVAVTRGRQDRFERDPLLVEQHEVAVRLDHRRDVLEQLAARPVPREQHASHDRLALAGRQAVVQELRELDRLVAGVERVAVQRLGVAIGPELAIGVVLVVVEVGDGGQRDRIGLVEDLVVVEQPLLVAADLDRWVEDAPDLLADVQLDAVVGGRRTDAAVAPLLELDDDRVLGARRGVAGEHRVEPPARVAELVLEDDAVVVQLGLVDEHRQRHQAVLPARHL